MSSADVTVHDTVAMVPQVRENGATRAMTVVAAIACAQLVWLALLVYGVIWLLT